MSSSSPVLPSYFTSHLSHYLEHFPLHEHVFWSHYLYLIFLGWNEECGETTEMNGAVVEVLLFQLYQHLEPTSTILPPIIPTLLTQARTSLLQYNSPYPSTSLADGTVHLRRYVEWLLGSEMTTLYRKRYENVISRGQQSTTQSAPQLPSTANLLTKTPSPSPITLPTITEESESATNSANTTPHRPRQSTGGSELNTPSPQKVNVKMFEFSPSQLSPSSVSPQSSPSHQQQYQQHLQYNQHQQYAQHLSHHSSSQQSHQYSHSHSEQKESHHQLQYHQPSSSILTSPVSSQSSFSISPTPSPIHSNERSHSLSSPTSSPSQSPIPSPPSTFPPFHTTPPTVLQQQYVLLVEKEQHAQQTIEKLEEKVLQMEDRLLQMETERTELLTAHEKQQRSQTELHTHTINVLQQRFNTQLQNVIEQHATEKDIEQSAIQETFDEQFQQWKQQKQQQFTQLIRDKENEYKEKMLQKETEHAAALHLKEQQHAAALQQHTLKEQQLLTVRDQTHQQFVTLQDSYSKQQHQLDSLQQRYDTIVHSEQLLQQNCQQLQEQLDEEQRKVQQQSIEYEQQQKSMQQQCADLQQNSRILLQQLANMQQREEQRNGEVEGLVKEIDEVSKQTNAWKEQQLLVLGLV